MVGSWPQTQMGRPGGQMQPAAWPLKNSLTVRSSSEWNEIAAMRPPGRSTRYASSRPRASDSSSLLTLMRSAWKTRRAGLPAAKRAGVGMAHLITSTSCPVVSKGCLARWRSMRRAMSCA